MNFFTEIKKLIKLKIALIILAGICLNVGLTIFWNKRAYDDSIVKLNKKLQDYGNDIDDKIPITDANNLNTFKNSMVTSIISILIWIILILFIIVIANSGQEQTTVNGQEQTTDNGQATGSNNSNNGDVPSDNGTIKALFT